MRSLDDYLALVPPAHAGKPRLMAELAVLLAPLVAVQQALAHLPTDFDLDEAVGVQLDAVGLWVGRSRDVAVPLPGAYFSFDIPELGFDLGLWKEAYDTPVSVAGLDDDTYRRLLYANIHAKHWDGTVPDAQTAFDIFFIDPATLVVVQDNAQVPFPRAVFAFDTVRQGFDEGYWDEHVGAVPSVGAVDVSMTIGVAGKLPPRIIVALLGQGGIPIKPSGVETRYEITSVDGAPLFGFDVDNAFVSGFDTGAWGVTPAQSLDLTAA